MQTAAPVTSSTVYLLPLFLSLITPQLFVYLCFRCVRVLSRHGAKVCKEEFQVCTAAGCGLTVHLQLEVVLCVGFHYSWLLAHPWVIRCGRHCKPPHIVSVLPTDLIFLFHSVQTSQLPQVQTYPRKNL